MQDEYQKHREVIEAATKEPWTHDGDSELGQHGDVTIWAAGEVVVSQVVDDGQDGYIGNMNNDLTPCANAEFIVQARTGWPAALDKLLGNRAAMGTGGMFSPVVERVKAEQLTKPDDILMTLTVSCDEQCDEQFSFRMTKSEALDLARALLREVASLEQTGD